MTVLNVFLTVLLTILTPMILLTAAGFGSRRLLKIDIRTLIRLNMYVFIPATLFVKIVQADVDLRFVLLVVGFILGAEGLMGLMSAGVSRVLGLSRSEKLAFGNSLLFFNSGNYGLPMAELAFAKSPVALAVQIFIMLTQNITSNTVGVFRANLGAGNTRSAWSAIIRLPSVYILILALSVRGFHLTVPQPLWSTMNYLSGGFVAIALITLGAQLADVSGHKHLPVALTSSMIRLVICPAVAIGACLVMGLQGQLAQSLVLGVSTPTAVNSAIIAREYGNEPDLAAQIVMVSTLLSCVTITAVLMVVRLVFP